MLDASARTGEDQLLLASGLGEDTGGGLFALEDDGAVVTLDRLSTSGVAVADGGRQLARLLWTSDDPQGCGELLVHDERGVLRYLRVDGLKEPHSALFDGDALVVVSTLRNSVLWLDEAGAVTREWRAPAAGEGDCWHLNSLVAHDGRLLVSAFGRFEDHRGWSVPGARAGAGIVIDIERGETVLSGFSAPHDPLPFEDGWLICNSGDGELLRLSRAGAVLQRVDLGGWTRGLTFDGEHLYVGVSAPRHQGLDGTASVRRLKRSTLEEDRRWELPSCSDVFSLVWCRRALAEGVRTGFGVNPRREAWDERLGPAADSLPRELVSEDAYDVWVSLCDPPPAEVSAGRGLALTVRIDNRGPATLRATGEEAVAIGARWESTDGLAGPQARAGLSGPLLPGGSQRAQLLLAAPQQPGHWILRVALVQEHVRWFDAGDARRGAAVPIEVVAA